MYSLETKNLTYHFSPGQRILSDLNLQMPAHGIYGFLGPNGAGKTTTMRLLLGLLQTQQGEVTILGEQLRRDRVKVLGRIGALIEAPSFYAHLSATENLRVLQKVYRNPLSRISYVLDITGLGNTGTKPVGQFSLGMKQRFGIAAALLHEPELLILDEPTNGLDPNGMIEIREMLLALNRQTGLSIFISSHLLAEIERLSTHLGIIHKGVLLFQGPLEDLQKKAGQHTVFTTDNPQTTLKIMSSFDPSAHVLEQSVYAGALLPANISEINRLLVQHNVSIWEISSRIEDLEKLFINLIQSV